MHRFWSGLASSVGLVGALFAGVEEVSACEPPPAGWRPASFAPGPANGVVLFEYACYVNCETLPAFENLTLRDSAGELVPGSVIFSQASDSSFVVAFRPEPGALREGGGYTAELDGVPAFADLLIAPALTWNDALTLTVDILEVDHPTGETKCCGDPPDSCGNLRCFRTEVDRRTTVRVDWREEMSVERDQYAFRFGRDGIEPAAPWTWSSSWVQFELDTTEDEACFELELKRLVDDSVQTFASRCVERPASFTPGLRATPDENIAIVLAGCDEPPADYEAAWCEARKEICDGSPDEPWCPEFTARCAMVGVAGAAGGTSVAGAAGRGGGAGVDAGGSGGGAGSSSAQAGTSSATAGSGGTGDAGAPDGGDGEAGGSAGGKRVYTKGCGCSLPGTSSREPALLLAALGFFLLRVRRTRKRASALILAR
jgi:MYXO-CTERM domain-containing protein